MIAYSTLIDLVQEEKYWQDGVVYFRYVMATDPYCELIPRGKKNENNGGLKMAVSTFNNFCLDRTVRVEKIYGVSILFSYEGN